MRVRVDVEADASSMRWEDVHGPARGVVYGLLRCENAALAETLHNEGWNGHPLKPLGLTSPQFRGAPRKKGVYTTSADGSVWFGSPVPEIATVLISGLASRRELVWGAVRLRVKGVAVETDAPAVDGPVELETATPMVIKHENRHLLPGEAHYVERLQHNLAHKADVLGLRAPEELRVLEAGPRRRFTVRAAPRVGAQVRVFMEAEARFVAALRSWGMGLETVQGFGWIR